MKTWLFDKLDRQYDPCRSDCISFKPCGWGKNDKFIKKKIKYLEQWLLYDFLTDLMLNIIIILFDTKIINNCRMHQFALNLHHTWEFYQIVFIPG